MENFQINLKLKSRPVFYCQHIIPKTVLYVRQCGRQKCTDTQAKYVKIMVRKSVDMHVR